MSEPLTLHPRISRQGDIVVLQLTGLLLGFATAALPRQLPSAVLCPGAQLRARLNLSLASPATGLKAQVGEGLPIQLLHWP